MGNEIQINVVLNDDTGAQRAKIKADYEAWAASLGPVNVTATNPIDEAWRAAADAGIKAAASEPVDVTFGANVDDVQATMEETFAAIRAAAAEPLMIGPANTEEFQSSALEAVASVRAEIEAAMSAPMELPPVYATATRLDQQAGGNGPLALPPGMGGEPPSFRPVYEPGPLFGGGAQNLAAESMGEAGMASSGMNSWLAALMKPFEGLGGMFSSFGQGMASNPWLSALGTPFQGMFGGGGGGGAPTQQQAMPQQAESQVTAAAQESLNAAKPVRLDIAASDPINDAFISKLKSSLKSISVDALNIPLSAETAAFAQQVEEEVQRLSEVTKANIPLVAGDAIAFREQVAEQVAEVSRSVKAVITVEADSGPMEDLRQKTLAAADAAARESQAQKDLADAMAKGDPAEIAKAQDALAVASKDAGTAAEEQAGAMTAAAAAEDAAGEAAKTTALSMGALNRAMGPLFLVMTVAQVAMMGFGSASQSTSLSAQDLSQQLIGLGKSGANAASSLSGNSGLSQLNDDFGKIGSSVAAFSQAFSGSIPMAVGYVNQLTDAQKHLGDTTVTTTQTVATYDQQGQQNGTRTAELTNTVADLSRQINVNSDAFKSLSQSVQNNITAYNAYPDIIKQAQKALADEKAAQALVTADLQQQGIVLSQAQTGWNSIGGAVANTVSEFNTATGGVKSLSDATVAGAAANEAAQAQFRQLDAAVTAAAQSYANAEHGIVTAEQGAQSAILGVQNAQYGATQAQQGYTTALQQEQQAQTALAAARKAAQQNLIDLQLQANDASASSLNANVALFDAQQQAAQLGVDASNVNAIASEQVTAQNEAQVKAAIALIQAMNQVADAHNGASQAQGNLSDAQRQGIDGNSGVVSANQAVVNSAQQVANAQHQMQAAQEAVTQANQALQNAQFAVNQAQEAARSASLAYKDAQASASTSTDINTAAGNRNWGMLEQLFEKNFTATGSIQQATGATEAEGQKMGFTAGQIDGVINSITRIPLVTDFSITGTPSLNLATLLSQASAEGISPYSLGLPAAQVDLARGPIGGSYAQGGPIGGGGGPTADDQLIWASSGEHMWTADEVQAAGGHGAMEAMRQAVKGYAGGGAITPQEAMGVNFRLAGWDAVLQGASFGLQALGANTPNLPHSTSSAIDFGTFAGGGAGGGGGAGAPVGGVSGSQAANEAIVKQVFASMFGWGSAPEWDATNYVMMRESGYDNTAQNPHSTAYGMFQFLDCVPLDTEILTEDGWKTWDTVQVGDRTLGYNPATGRSEWTPILAKVVKAPQQVVRMSVGNWSARVTPGHRWMSERRATEPVAPHELACPECGATRTKRGPFRSSRAVQTHMGRAHGILREPQPYVRSEEFVRTDSITTAHRLRVAADVDDTNGNDQLSNAEVALLGWIVGDGHINHACRTTNVWIYQAKVRFLPVIDALLDGIPHSRYVRDRNPGKHLPAVAWRLAAPYARDLLRRSRIEDGPDAFVLSLSSKQREIWLDAVWQAEGWTVPSGDSVVRRFAQNEGPWASAMVLAAYLCGYRPTFHSNVREKAAPHHGNNLVVTLGRPWIGGTQIHIEDVGSEPVWCVNTGLGTWTMRQGGLPMLTGNSTWAHYGIPKTSDPTQQAVAGGRYIGSRYQDPIGAAAHERAFSWYGAGGPAGGLVGINDGGPEAITLPNGSTVIPAANTAGLTQGQSVVKVELDVNFGGNTEGAFATAFMKLVRGGQIQLTANGQRVKVG